ncbi:MAG: hypothetical protein Q8T08_00305, partial [Ignavibacteria bacterium]|nr:hypothetical protein [Ignavibacteria bacterium]
ANQIISDRNGISQSLNARETYTNILENHVEDDCGNVSASYDFSMQYTTSVSPIHFMVNIRGAAIDFGGYYIEISYRRTVDEPISRTATYDLYTDASRDDQATFKMIDNYIVDDFNYGTVLEISYTKMSLSTAVHKIWFAKQYGIIRFSDVGGNVFTINRNMQP